MDIATLHTDDAFADACWSRTAAHSRACYNTNLGPGQPVRAPPNAPRAPEDDREGAESRRHVAAIACRVTFVDWLYLSSAGHRRAQLRWEEKRLTSRWVGP